MTRYDDDFLHEYPRKEAEEIRKKKRKKKATIVPQNVKKAKSTPSIGTICKKPEED